VNKQDTTAVLSPDSGAADENEKNSQPAPKPAFATDGLNKAAAERKRSPKLSEDKRFKIF